MVRKRREETREHPPRIIARRTAIEPVISERVSIRRNFRSESLTARSDNRLTAEHEGPSDSSIVSRELLVPSRDTRLFER